MGQTLTTPLSLTLGHWKDVRIRANNLSVEIKKSKWQALCTSEWPTFKVEWPAEGTFNINIILQVKGRIFEQGHRDQAPYIVVWESLVKEPPSWVSPFVPPCPPLSPSAPPPPPPTPHPARSTPPIPTPRPRQTPTDPSKPPTSSNLYPIVPTESPSSNNDSSLRRPRQVLPPEESPLIDLLTEDPPPYHPPRPASGPMGESDHPSPIAGRVRGRQRPEQGETSKLFPLRQGREPGSLQYWPFSASDLYNWKSHNPSFSQDPMALTALIESILVTHQPTWDDCQQLLQALLTTEERQRVFLEARKNVPGDDGRPTQLPNVIDETFPLTRPDWDFNTAAGRTHLRLYRQLLIAGLHNAGRRPTNLAQVRQVTQGKEESPTAFLERLKEAYRRYMPFDPNSDEQRGNVSMTFIWQSAPDIRNKLQRLENLQDFSLQDLLKEAEKIFNKRETQEKKEDYVQP
ncbi:inverted formin-2-like [Mustela putorius furo]|uniref:Inverted formin-2-like n=1 Tax=Mustela putorius furo TaxID=9669 RepID=A0A8U0UQA4_MUSPF|nr:inverted formin-2-like [Mustela putorius furo]